MINNYDKFIPLFLAIAQTIIFIYAIYSGMFLSIVFSFIGMIMLWLLVYVDIKVRKQIRRKLD
jgi:hypothetical protein